MYGINLEGERFTNKIRKVENILKNVSQPLKQVV